MSAEDVSIGEGFAFFTWHRLRWPRATCKGHRWCFECTHGWRYRSAK